MRCRVCEKRYTATPNVHGDDRAVRARAMRVVADGLNVRRAARLLQVHHTTMVYWKRQAARRLPDTPSQPQMVHHVELDELYTVVGAKKPLLPDHSRRPYDSHDRKVGRGG